MCDTVVALGSATVDGATLFGKNSDRHPNEAQAVVWVPAAEHSLGERVRCTYLDIPQARWTHAAVLCQPFWMWGAEMGFNEHGVAIGNEAIFTREPHTRQPALTGMDLVRLGLQRATDAEQAVGVMTELLEAYGQGGNCGYDGELRYHNSFIVADANAAWVLETVGRHWVAQEVRHTRSISNRATIAGLGDRRSEGLLHHAVQRGWCSASDRFDFAADVSDRLYTTAAAGRARCAATTSFLQRRAGSLDVADIMALLRSHAQPPGKFDPAHGLTGADVCMHAGPGPIRISHTVGSLVCRIDADGITGWITGTSTPCTSIFGPVWVDAGAPTALRALPKAQDDSSTLWWRHERLARLVQRDYRQRHRVYAEDRDALERELLGESLDAIGQGVQERSAVSERCLSRADQARVEWLARVQGLAWRPRLPRLYDLAWRRFDRRAGL